MKLTVRKIENLTLAEMQAFLEGNQAVEWTLEDRQEVYLWVERLLAHHQYSHLKKNTRGLIRRFVEKVTGLSRSQTTRLIGQWLECRQIRRKKRVERPRFARRYTPADIALLARVDAAHEDLSGPATRRICQQEYAGFGHPAFERLAKISNGHLYNLRRRPTYRNHRRRIEKTRPRQVAIGERRRPDPRGLPGYLRVDTVHQGHADGRPGLYHLNAVDTVTQWQVVGCVETICEEQMVVVLEAMLHQFPFAIRGFHSDNGGEFVNGKVAGMLERLLVKAFTKSRARRTTDNALVEGKNGAVVRKHIGYGPIGAQHAEDFQRFYTAHFNSYLNFSRPCAFATVEIGKRGQQHRRYPDKNYVTPYQRLCSLPDWERHLKPGTTAARLEQQARRASPTEAAERMQAAKDALLKRCRSTR